MDRVKTLVTATVLLTVLYTLHKVDRWTRPPTNVEPA